MNADLFQPADHAAGQPRQSAARSDDDAARTDDDAASGRRSTSTTPLADRMRPRSLEAVVGQSDLLRPGGPLRGLLEADRPLSLLLWGPPGCGKTTLGRLVAEHSRARFLEYSAVAVGAKELKSVMVESVKFQQATGRRTILFLDEIHRFNKAQQDALLPWVERGDVQLIGATTENPSFELNAALLSRLRLFVLSPLAATEVRTVLDRALAAPEGLAASGVSFTPAALIALSELSEGDARLALGWLESVAAVVAERRVRPQDSPGTAGMGSAAAVATETVDVEDLADLIQHRAARYDKSGEEHFNLISALHKSLRNSDVQAAVYWLARMLAGGEDPLYIARRLVRFASEDVGLADPQALVQTVAARDAVRFIGLPEGALALAQAVVYLALAPKSNRLYVAHQSASKTVEKGHNPPPPLHIRNAPTQMMKGLGYGRDYIYAPDTADGIAAMDCLPEALRDHVFYQPSAKGFEAELQQRLEQIAAWHRRRAATSTEHDRDETGGDT